ncbi:hypothetical protein F4680DRAFT_188251 [Xylaria scruposa]|nr:hypothetical protein F4680DRAFT_188251 [Xylaria scruposa]
MQRILLLSGPCASCLLLWETGGVALKTKEGGERERKEVVGGWDEEKKERRPITLCATDSGAWAVVLCSGITSSLKSLLACWLLHSLAVRTFSAATGSAAFFSRADMQVLPPTAR